MNNIGALFKELGNNPIFFTYVEDGYKHQRSNSEIIERSIADAELMAVLTALVESVDAIKTKMDIVIGQKIKKFKESKKENEESTNNSPDSKNNIEYELHEETDIPVNVFANLCEPVDPNNVIWLWDRCYIERVGQYTRLVINNTELLY